MNNYFEYGKLIIEKPNIDDQTLKPTERRYQSRSKKIKQIYIHHTAGWNSYANMGVPFQIEGAFSGIGYRNNNQSYNVSLNADDGKIYQTVNYKKYWHCHLGILKGTSGPKHLKSYGWFENNKEKDIKMYGRFQSSIPGGTYGCSFDDDTIGIELINYGYVYKAEESGATVYKNRASSSLSSAILRIEDSQGSETALSSEYIQHYTEEMSKEVFNKNGTWKKFFSPGSDDNDYKKGYRGNEYFLKYSDKQLESLKKLLVYLCIEEDIPMQNDKEKIFHMIPDFSALPLPKDPFSKAINKYPGIYTHTTVKVDKSDCHPQPELIQVLTEIDYLGKALNICENLKKSIILNYSDLEEPFLENQYQMFGIDVIADNFINGILDKYVNAPSAINSYLEQKAKPEYVSGMKQMANRLFDLLDNAQYKQLIGVDQVVQ
ncbi:MAG TPA: hypothetical protein DCS93_31520 [Microscillaceae bacterium]|nr:hypothetical protein [Microscillaceae bacterium]